MSASRRSLPCQKKRRIHWKRDKLHNPRAADDFFFLVEDGGVAGGDGALGLVEGDEHALAAVGRCYWLDPCWSWALAVADAGLNAQAPRERRDADPVGAVAGEAGPVQLGFGADGDVAAGGVDVQHVERVGRGDAEALALADRKVVDALVAAERLAGGGDELACGFGDGFALLL